jgi:hypothetical protein
MPNITKKNNLMKIFNLFSSRTAKPVKITPQALENKKKVVIEKKKERNVEIQRLKAIEDGTFIGDRTQRPEILKTQKEYAKAELSYLKLSDSYDKQEKKFW